MNFFINNPLNMTKSFEPQIQNAFALKSEGIVNQKPVFENTLIPAQRIANYSGFNYQGKAASSVGIITIEGVLTRNRSWYSISYEDIAETIRRFDADPNCPVIILKITTPGGTADGNYIAAEAVRKAKKKVVVFTSYCYSAGYFIASQADLIILDKQAASGIGSIGTMMAYYDYSKSMAQQGVDLTFFRAEGSEEKNLVNGVEPLSEETKTKIITSCTDCRNEFASAAIRGRGGKLKNEALTGAEFNMQQALKYGVVDKVGNWEFAQVESLKLAS